MADEKLPARIGASSRTPGRTRGEVTVHDFLGDFSPSVRQLALLARERVLGVIPAALEHVRLGWRVIAYRVPTGRTSRYFAFVAPYEHEVRLGFEHGIHMDDPHRLLRGDGKQVRYILLQTPADATDALSSYIAQAAAIARLPRGALR